MGSYILRRLAGLVPTVLLLIFVVVAMMSLLPGDAVDQLLADRATSVDAAGRAEIRRSLGLDHSMPVAYVLYVRRLLRGDLGESLWS